MNISKSKSGESICCRHDDYEHVKSKCEAEKDATLSLLVTSFEQNIGDSNINSSVCQVEEAEHENVPVWLHPLTKSLNMKLVMPNSSNAATPDLELSLAVPKAKNMEQDKTSSSSFLIGPISVT